MNSQFGLNNTVIKVVGTIAASTLLAVTTILPQAAFSQRTPDGSSDPRVDPDLPNVNTDSNDTNRNSPPPLNSPGQDNNRQNNNRTNQRNNSGTGGGTGGTGVDSNQTQQPDNRIERYTQPGSTDPNRNTQYTTPSTNAPRQNNTTNQRNQNNNSTGTGGGTGGTGTNNTTSPSGNTGNYGSDGTGGGTGGSGAVPGLW